MPALPCTEGYASENIREIKTLIYTQVHLTN